MQRSLQCGKESLHAGNDQLITAKSSSGEVRIVEFGKKIGSGSCYTLVFNHLRSRVCVSIRVFEKPSPCSQLVCIGEVSHEFDIATQSFEVIGVAQKNPKSYPFTCAIFLLRYFPSSSTLCAPSTSQWRKFVLEFLLFSGIYVQFFMPNPLPDRLFHTALGHPHGLACSINANIKRRPVYIPNRINDPSYVRIFDTTLRDGEQSPGATMTSKEKLDVARQLAKLGVDIIEADFPIASPDDLEAVKDDCNRSG
eukprot:Gb_22738 [translate_table: standard]